MTAMGALNVTLDKKTKDMLARMASEHDGPPHDVHEIHRRRTMENVANLAINSQIQLILPPDGPGDNIGGGAPQGHVGRGRGRGRGGRGRGRAGRGRYVGTLQGNGKMQCNSCQRSYVLARFQG